MRQVLTNILAIVLTIVGMAILFLVTSNVSVAIALLEAATLVIVVRLLVSLWHTGYRRWGK
jgi:hypothetical protein